MNYFVTAIDTDSGKTMTSAILCEALKADYWKPIQAGLPKDSDTVKQLLSNPATKIHPELYLLDTPASPHAAAKFQNIEIDLNKFTIPETNRDLVIEGAGGCLVPLNQDDFVIDIAKSLNCEIILVSDLYLGSINHTLLTAECLKKRKLNVKGIIFNGPDNPESIQIILKHTGYRKLLHIMREEQMSKLEISKYAQQLMESWYA